MLDLQILYPLAGLPAPQGRDKSPHSGGDGEMGNDSMTRPEKISLTGPASPHPQPFSGRGQGSLPLSTVPARVNRVPGRIIAAAALTGMLLGLFLALALYVIGLLRLMPPPDPPGDPSLSLNALTQLRVLNAAPETDQNTGLAPGLNAGQSLTLRNDDAVRTVLLLSRPLSEQAGSVKTEVLLLLSLNRRTRTVRLVALDRTLPAYIPGKGWSLLGHASCMGGAELARQTVQENYRIPIEDTIVFDFARLAPIVDQLGGVTLPVGEAEAVWLRQNQPQLSVHPGLNRMGGELAVAYSQITGIDSHRQQNRRALNLLSALFERSGEQSVRTLKMLAEELLPGLQTAMPLFRRYQVLREIYAARGLPVSALAWPENEAEASVKSLHAFLFE